MYTRFQIKYGPKVTPDVGLTDGETMERLWSYMRGFSSITKEMSAHNRIDLLSEALEHYATKITNKMGEKGFLSIS